MKVLSIIEARKINKSGLCPVVFQAYIEKSKFTISSGEKVLPDHWEKEKSECKRTHPNYQYINSILKNKSAFIETRFYQAKALQVDDIKSFIRSEFDKKYNSDVIRVVREKDLFFEMWEEWLTYKSGQVSRVTGRVISTSTIQNHTSAKNYYKSFQDAVWSRKIKHQDIDDEFYAKLSAWHVSKPKNSPNTLGKYVKILKQYMDWSRKKLKAKGIIIENTWENFHAPDKYMGVDYLTPEEVALFYAAELSPGLSRTRNYFLSMMSVGQHHGDFMNMKVDMIDKANRVLIMDRKKTLMPLIIPMIDDDLFKPLEWMDKIFVNGAIPYLSNDTMNFNLREICRKIGFTRIPVTTKIGRKTYASIQVFYYKKQPRLIMRVTGHESESEFARYLGVDKIDFVRLYTQ